MSDPRISDPHVLDQPWTVGASSVVIVILLFGVALSVLIIPVVQGRRAGIDMYTAICRALGILPGSPAQPQPATVSPPTPVSKVVWTPEVLQILARGNTERVRAKVLEACAACTRPGPGGPTASPLLPEQGRGSLAQPWRSCASGERRNAVYARMRVIAAKLTPGGVGGLSRYYSAGFR